MTTALVRRDPLHADDEYTANWLRESGFTEEVVHNLIYLLVPWNASSALTLGYDEGGYINK